MASRWLREITTDSNSSLNQKWWRKAYALWLYHIMDFSLQTESVSGGRSWVSTEKTGTNGSFSGSSETLTDATAASFVADDVGKFLIVKDNTNPSTGGIYRIIQYISATQVVIDFRAGYGEYPASASGLSWWICAGTYQIPIAGEYARFQSRHTTGWAVELYYGGWPYYSLRFRVAPDGNWSNQIIGTYSDPDRYSIGISTSFLDTVTAGRCTHWAEGDYDNCEWINMWKQELEMVIGSITPQTAVGIRMWRIARIDPITAGYDDNELIVLNGARMESIGTDQDVGDRYYNGTNNGGRTYSRLSAGEVDGFLFDYSLGSYLNAFARWPARQVNWRRGGQREAFYGTPYIIDENNVNSRYQILGYLKGHWTIPVIPNRDPNMTANMDHGTGRSIYVRRMVPMNMGGGHRNVLQITDGFLVPWCGLSIINQGIL